MPAKPKGRGRLIVGARPLARFVFQDEEKWRSMYTPAIRQDLGLIMLGNRLAGYEVVIEERLAAKVDAALTESPRQRAAASAAAS
jgi:hypothetical protein